MSRGSGEYSKLPIMPEHDQTLVNQRYELPPTPKATTLFHNDTLRFYPTPYPKDKPDEENRIKQEQVYDIPQDRVIHFPQYLLVLPHFSRVPTRTVGELTFNTQRQRHEFVDRQGTEIDIYYVYYTIKITINVIYLLTLVN